MTTLLENLEETALDSTTSQIMMIGRFYYRHRVWLITTDLLTSSLTYFHLDMNLGQSRSGQLN